MLVCDDDPSLLEVGRVLLTTHGYRVTTARSGAEAVTKAAEEHPAVIVLDLFMPTMDGWHTVEALKASPETAAIPVLVLSVLDPDDGAGLADRVEKWLTKPIEDGDALIGAVEQLVGGDDAGVPRARRRGRRRPGADPRRVARAARACASRWPPTVASARRLGRTFIPDLIVLDVSLPDGDGFELVEQLREDGRLASTPLVVYTASDLTAEDRARLTLGDTEVLLKSTVAPDDFEQRLLTLLERATGVEARRTRVTARRVLIIDDDDGIREVAKMSLELVAGWDVSTAGSGAEGLARARESPPEGILLDVMMPGMDGPATLDRAAGRRRHRVHARDLPDRQGAGRRAHPLRRDGRRRADRQAVRPDEAGEPDRRSPRLGPVSEQPVGGRSGHLAVRAGGAVDAPPRRRRRSHRRDPLVRGVRPRGR